ncbi:AAA family ATPase [Congregibacter variabilis]|uniref:AAA family ATPase n=1 Tax=Congregibacter variabilis TaxID=3081200 RepID=A0ABZ0I3U7_9GAMM|nr:AAA family ATPase [Congregibacter sp. IMCC43200]
MYYQYFGLSEAPFSIAVNPRYLYMSPRHRDALAHLLYGVGSGGGFILLTGEVGTGKTTINRCLIEQLPENADIAIVLNPALDSRDMLATVCEELHITFTEARPGLKELTDSLHRFLLKNHAKGRKTVLMIDEAQHLSFDVLEQIRLLTNLETSDEKLLHIILIGQPELAVKLARPELRQLNQRITARFDLQPLTLAETSAYIRHRLHVGGMPAGRELFSSGLVRAIHRESRGIPRLINLLCDRMLLGAYGRDSDQLDRGLLKQAVKEVLGGDDSLRPSQSALLRPMVIVGVLLLLGAVAVWVAVSPTSSPPRLASTNALATGELRPQAPSAQESQGGPSSSASEATEELKWRLSPKEGALRLGMLYGAQQSMPDNPCAAVLSLDLRCEQRQLQSWNQLVNEGRPALLGLVDERRFEGRALLLAIEEETAVLDTQAGVQRVDLQTLAAQWTGTVWQLWRPSPGVARTLELGDSGEDVARIAALFARLDGQQQALTESLFDARLEQRVKLFQQQHSLRADGVLGENTLRALSLAVGDDLGFSDALSWASANAARVPVTP